MRIFVISDIHIDYPQNKDWLFSLSRMDYREDVLILAGDISDDLRLLEHCFYHLEAIFLRVLFVPGNHELWVKRGEPRCSIKKFEAVCRLASDCNISMKTCRFESLSIVPLLAWYDFSFDEPAQQIKEVWSDFHYCSWPEGYEVSNITEYFLEMNSAALDEKNETIITFSHFLPTLDVLPAGIPEKYRILHPVLGSRSLGDQVDQIKPDIHVYGHSHVNRDINLNGIRYINSAFGYPYEGWAQKGLLCIHQQ